jgi:hypothetical protein
LDTAGNNFSSVGITSGRHVTLVDSNALELSASTITGTLTVTAGGALTQSGALVVTGTSSFTAGANAITLTHAANDFMGAVSLNNSGAHNVAVTGANALILGPSSVGTGTLQTEITSNLLAATLATLEPRTSRLAELEQRCVAGQGRPDSLACDE